MSDIICHYYYHYLSLSLLLLSLHWEEVQCFKYVIIFHYYYNYLSLSSLLFSLDLVEEQCIKSVIIIFIICHYYLYYYHWIGRRTMFQVRHYYLSSATTDADQTLLYVVAVSLSPWNSAAAELVEERHFTWSMLSLTPQPK